MAYYNTGFFPPSDPQGAALPGADATQPAADNVPPTSYWLDMHGLPHPVYVQGLPDVSGQLTGFWDDQPPAAVELNADDGGAWTVTFAKKQDACPFCGHMPVSGDAHRLDLCVVTLPSGRVICILPVTADAKQYAQGAEQRARGIALAGVPS